MDWKAVPTAIGARLQRKDPDSGTSSGHGANRRVLGVAVAFLVLVGAAAVVFGVPRDAKLVGLLSGHGWLSNDKQGQVVLANGETGLVDYRDTLSETALNRIEVVQSGNNAVLVDTSTGEEGSLSPGNPSASVKLHRVAGAGSGDSALGTSSVTSAKTELVPMSDGNLYAVNRGSGYVSVVDPLTGHVIAKKYVGPRSHPGGRRQARRNVGRKPELGRAGRDCSSPGAHCT